METCQWRDLPAGVSKNGIGVQLSINPGFFTNLNEKQRIGLLKHELLHVSFGHITMRDRFSNHKLFNIAADLEINQYIAVDSTIETAIGYTLEIVEPIFDDEVLPDNPAIWETEPKEQVDLDIYYEASQEYPIVLN